MSDRPDSDYGPGDKVTAGDYVLLDPSVFKGENVFPGQDPPDEDKTFEDLVLFLQKYH